MRRIVPISALAILLAATLAVPASASTDTDDSISPELRAALKAPLGKRIKELLNEKNDVGSSYVYGSYYDSFDPVGDGYNVTFIKRISGPDELVAERYTMTLKQEGGEWKVDLNK